MQIAVIIPITICTKMFQDAISAYPEHHHMERKRKQLTKGES